MTDELAIRQRLKDDFTHYAPKVLKIRKKSGDVSAFTLNKAQMYIHNCLEQQKKNTGKVRAIILKGRQQGASTLIGGRYYWQVTHRKGVRAFILTHEAESTSALFEMTERYHEHANPLVKPSTGASNAKELVFDKLDSGYKLGTAGNKSVGRGTTVQYFHGCLAEGTKVLTPDLRECDIERFNVGDLVVTHTGKIAPVTFISTQEKECFDIRLYASSQIVTSSAEHRYLTPTGWKELSDLVVGDVVGYPVRTIQHTITQVDLKLPDVPRSQKGGTVERIPETIPTDYNLGRVFGLYLAEGTIKLQNKSGQYSCVQFTVHDREVKRTVEWLKPFSHCFASIKVQSREDCKTSIVTAYGKSFAALVDRLCRRTSGKQLPNGWYDMGNDFVKGLVHGYLSGDGHSSKRQYDRRISAPSIREAITYGIRDALAALGYGWSVVAYRAGAIRNGRNEQSQWTLRLSGPGVDVLVDELGWDMPARKRKATQHVEIKDGYVWLPIKEINPVGIKTVYDFEVGHDDHSYCLVSCATHNSEVAFWPNASEHAKGILQAVPDEAGTEVILESTANGIGNYFHQQWQKAEAGESEYQAIFVPWFWQDEYRKPVKDDITLSDEEESLKQLYHLDNEQLQFRRSKIAELSADGIDGESAFKQEYPMNANEAFQVSGGDTLISPIDVMQARKCKQIASGDLIIGVDPARFGDDRTAIIRRRGRNAYKLQSYAKKSTMEVAGIVHQIIINENPAQVAVDVVGLGAGVYDRLVELGHGDIVVAVNAASAALDPERYINKRAEMWWTMRDWLAGDLPVSIPDSDEMHADLCAPFYKFNSQSRRQLESKDDIKKRGLRSPDTGDALALTFAEPVKKKKPKKHIDTHRVADRTVGY